MSELLAEQLVDEKYRIVRHVGAGAWASVYEAINIRIQRRVAIKVLNPVLTAQEDLKVRFTREAEAATQIESPFVVTVFDAGVLPDGCPYIVMEFLQGESLGKRLESGALPEEEAVRYVMQLLSGLADAHSTGIIHRDIKPDNLVIVKTKKGDEILKIVDFGISKPQSARPEMMSMTKTNSVLGSPVYMSPEQARGLKTVDGRTDLYSAGVVLFEALTGSWPHNADTFNELMFKVALEDAPDPRTIKASLDPALATIVLKALSREVENRYESALAFRDALADWMAERGESVPSSRMYGSGHLHVRSSNPRIERASDFEVKATLLVDEAPSASQGVSAASSSATKGIPASTTKSAALTQTPAEILPKVTSTLTKAVVSDVTPKFPKPRRHLFIASGAVAGLVALVVIGKLALGGGSSTTTAPGASIVQTVTPPPPPTQVLPPPEPRESPPQTVADSPATAATADSKSPPAVATPQPQAPVGIAPRPRQPAPVASTAPSTSAKPASAASANTVIEGRTIRTGF